MDANETFIIIPESVQRDERIDWPHRAIWGIVYAFSRNGGECWLSVEQIGERIHRKRRQTSSMIQELLNLGLIEIASWNGRKRSLRTTIELANSNARNSAHVQSAAHQPRGISHISRAEFRTSAARNSAHKEYKKEEKKEENNTLKGKNLDVVKITDSKKPSKRKNSGQKPSTIDECREFFQANNSNVADDFWDYWSSYGWKSKGKTIVCWKSAARRWIRNDIKFNGTKNERIDKNKPFDATDAINWANQ